ncbi:MAG: hypothetical protein AAGO57_09075 [Pseudomonadota bacterium]
MPTWAYILGALLASHLGAAAVVVLYFVGGSMFMKIGLVALPIALYLVVRARGGKSKDEG